MARLTLSPKFLCAASLLVLNLSIACLLPNPVSSPLSTLLFVGVIFFTFLSNPIAIVLLSPFVVLDISVMISLNVIDAGSFLKEMGRFGEQSPAAASFAIYALLMLAVAAAIFQKLQKKNFFISRSDFFVKQNVLALFQISILFFWILSTLYMVFEGARTGFPLLTGLDRFEYRRLHASVLLINILDLKILPAATLGSVATFAAMRWIRYAAIFTFILYVLLGFLFGDKFFIEIIAILTFLTPLIIVSAQGVLRRVRRAVPAMLVGLLAVFFVTAYIYSGYGALSSRETEDRLGDRVAGQGELWFMATQQAPKVLDFDATAVAENLQSLIENPSYLYMFDKHLGPYYFLYMYSPPKMYQSFVRNAGFVTPTMAFEAYGLVLFGYGGLAILVVAAGAFLGLLIAILYHAIMTRNPFYILLPAFIFSGTEKALTQATLYTLVSVSTFKGDAAFLVLTILVAGASRALGVRSSGDFGRATRGTPNVAPGR